MLQFHECAANINDVPCRYGGHVVAKLPFEPFSLLAKLAHRGITTPSANDCSVVRPHPCPAACLTMHLSTLAL